MSRWKSFAVRSGVLLLILGGMPLLWYQSHYAQPLAPPTEKKLPSPNGYDTLIQATEAQVGQVRWVPPPDSYKESLAERKKLLAANQRFLDRTRDAIAQEFMVTDSYSEVGTYADHLGQLYFLGQTYADSGNYSEALRCALDMLELGLMAPRGGDLTAREAGHLYEKYGRQLAWQIVEHIEGKSAREAALRLEKMEEKRWPLPESLREELQHRNNGSRFLEFKDGPIFLWERLALGNTETYSQSYPTTRDTTPFWERVKTVYGGPKALEDAAATWVKWAEEQADRPWNPARSWGIPDGPLSQESFLQTHYSDLELSEAYTRTESSLLRGYLALHAYKREHGAYPESLATLVTKGYLHRVTPDPFSSTFDPLQYQPGGKLWSVGPDGKDNGGKSNGVEAGEWTSGQPSGDVLPRM